MMSTNRKIECSNTILLYIPSEYHTSLCCTSLYNYHPSFCVHSPLFLNPKMNKAVLSFYAEEMNTICMNLESENQVFLCGLDKRVISIILQRVSLIFKKKGFSILNLEDDISKDGISRSKDGSLCIVDVGECTSLSKNKLLYFYLEQSLSSKTKVLMYSDDCSSLDTLERRVKSRFSDNTIFLRTLTLDIYTSLCASPVERQYKIFPSLDKLEEIYLREKYKIEEFTDTHLLSLLNNIHLAILILSTKRKLLYNTVVREFRIFTVKINPLKNVRDEEVLFYYYDLLNFGLVGEKGVFLYNDLKLKEFVMTNSPTYLKNLLK